MGLTAMLKTEDLSRAYRRGSWALDGVSLTVNKGEVVGLLGRNGAGKTTLLRCVMGMLHPQRGSLSVLGMRPWKDAVAIKRRIGFVSAGQAFPGFLTIAEVIAMHKGLFQSWDSTLEQRLCNRFELEPGRKIGTLSTGQARQVALVCAVAHRPELLILDEPDGGLDPSVRRELLEAAIELLAEGGSTVLFSSHHMSDVERIAQRALIIEQGELVLDRSIDELRESCCLAVLPAEAPSAALLEGTDVCLRSQRRNGSARMLLDLPPATAKQKLRDEMPSDQFRVSALSLEQLFIELVGRS